jgi:rod shape-determining protein MreD
MEAGAIVERRGGGAVKWLTFAVCAVGILTLQTTLAAHVELLSVRPDWVFVLVVFFALYCPRSEAFLAAWVLGFAVDLLSIERMGLMAITYATSALLVNGVREFVFLKSAMTHFMATLGGCLVLNAMLGVYRVVALDSYAGWMHVALEGVGTSIYTAVWAIPIHHFLVKASGLLGVRDTVSARPRTAGPGGNRV